MYEFIMFMLHTDNFTWTFRLCACVSECVLSIYLSSSLQKLIHFFIYFPHLNKVTNCSICVVLRASFTAVYLVNNSSTWVMVQEIVTDFCHQTDDDLFFYYKVKTVLFVSSGPKPCEACRQEEIYEEPISILNSNEVSYEVCFFCQHCALMRHLPHPHSV